MSANQTHHVLETIRAIVPKSFDKAFAKVSDDALIAGMDVCIRDLTAQQIDVGLNTVREMGFCPDPALFRRWCLGQKDFGDTVADSYIGKTGALSNLIAWLNDPSAPISTAVKQAYDKTYQMFANIHSDYDKTQAHTAFKDAYEHIVKANIHERIASTPYTAPIAVASPKTKTLSEDERHHHRAMGEMRAKAQLLNLARQTKGLNPVQIPGLTT